MVAEVLGSAVSGLIQCLFCGHTALPSYCVFMWGPLSLCGLLHCFAMLVQMHIYLKLFIPNASIGDMFSLRVHCK